MKTPQKEIPEKKAVPLNSSQIKNGGLSAFFAENRSKILEFGEYFLEKLSDEDVLYYKGYMKYTTTITHAIPLFATLSA